MSHCFTSFLFRYAQPFALAMLCGFLILACSTIGFGQEEEFTQDEQEFSQNANGKDDPIALFNRGQEEHSKGRLKQALELYQMALKANPEFPEAAYQIGMVFKLLNKAKAAEESFLKCINLREDWALPYLELGLLYLKQSNLADSKTFLTKSLGLDPENILTYQALGNVLVKTNASQNELEILLKGLDRLSNGKSASVAVWTSKASVERNLGRIANAKKSLKKAFSIDPNDKVALAEMVELLIIEKNAPKAIELSKALIRLEPESRNAKLLLARSYNLKGDSENALGVLRRIKSPDKEILAFKNALETNGNLSVESLEQMLKDRPNSVSVLGRLCSITRASAPNKALEYCKKALVLEKSNINYAVGYGAALVQLKRYVQAIRVLQNLLKHSPDNYAIHANLATAYFQLKNFPAAKLEYNWIVQKRPKLAVAHYFLAISADRMSEYVSAYKSYKTFLSLADLKTNQLEIEKVNLRLPILERQIKRRGGKIN